MAFSFFGLFNKNRFFSENYDPNFNNYSIGSKEPILINLDELDKVYHKIPHLKTVINNVALLVSNGKWKMLDKEGQEIEQHELLTLLKNPNKMQSEKDLLFGMSANESVFGNTFIFENKAFKNSFPTALWLLKGNNLKVNLTGKYFKQTEIKDIIKSYEFDNGTVKEVFTPDELIHIKTEGIDLIVEQSKIKTLHQQLSNLKNAYDSRNILLTERGGIGIVSVESKKGDLIPMSPKEKEEIEKKWTKKYGIGKNQKRTSFSSTPIKFTPTNFPTKDLMLFEEVQDDFNCIIDAYGYNLNLLSNAKGSTFENVKESLKLVYQNTVIPRAERYANILSNRYGLKEQGLKLVLDYSHIPVLQENLKEQAEILKLKADSLSEITNVLNSEQLDKEVKEYLLSLLKS